MAQRKFNYPEYPFQVEEQALYRTRLQEHAQSKAYTVEGYIKTSGKRYVIISNADQPQHWENENVLDETDWCVYPTREHAEAERQMLIGLGDYGHRVITERYFLKMKGLI